MFLPVFGIGSAAPIVAPGAITMRFAESEISAAAEYARGSTYAITGMLAENSASRIRNAAVYQTARAVDVEDDRGGVLAIGFGNGAFDQMGHSVVDRPLDRHDHDLAGLGGRGGRAGGGSRQAANQQPQGDPSPNACYPHAPTLPAENEKVASPGFSAGS